ncbi:alkyl sulfatase dimerization domain-containing protein [Sinorhizobium meliloti]|uniref:alkyl sulfatase dimerization domain-containing protein n=1 Tax=Rhizobium meliloti TaxID=382 RepID=UPI002E114741|nr:alkyl sulfatase dimerization domain-containing protein [Sinorhizobium meliloti]
MKCPLAAIGAASREPCESSADVLAGRSSDWRDCRVRGGYVYPQDRYQNPHSGHKPKASPNPTTGRQEAHGRCLQQLGYRAESGRWRNFYLTGTKELREAGCRYADHANAR